MSFNEIISIKFRSKLNSRKKYSLRRRTSHGTWLIPFTLRIIILKAFSIHMQFALCVSLSKVMTVI